MDLSKLKIDLNKLKIHDWVSVLWYDRSNRQICKVVGRTFEGRHFLITKEDEGWILDRDFIDKNDFRYHISKKYINEPVSWVNINDLSLSSTRIYKISTFIYN